MPLTRDIPTEHSEEVDEIISQVPSWILRRGIVIIISVLVSILLSSAFIRYPEIIKTTLKVNSINAPKEVLAHQEGKLVKILIVDNQMVKAGQPIAFLESTARHADVLDFSAKLKALYEVIIKSQPGVQMVFINQGWNLGELQTSFQNFFQDYALFANTQTGGFYLTQKAFLERDVEEIRKLERQILLQKNIQEKEFANIEEEYEAYKKLKSKNVISNSEFKQQENKFFSGKYPLQQTETALLNNRSSILGKEKELATLNNTIKEQRAKFLQALNSIISETESWKMKYVVSSPVNGRATYAGILQENQNVTLNQALFVINPGNSNFFGEVQIPQYNMGKIKVGQRSLVKLRSYPFEEFGMINGKVSVVADFALKDSVFLAKIDFERIQGKHSQQAIVLKPGMMADVDIVTKESSLLERFLQNLVKIFDHN